MLAGGTAAINDRTFDLTADRNGTNYSIGDNNYLASRATSLSYRATIATNLDGTWSYRETTTLKMSQMPEPFAHSDRNTLRRVG